MLEARNTSWLSGIMPKSGVDKISSTSLIESISPRAAREDRKSTRLNSSHLVISYAVFCLKKKNHGSARLVHGNHALAIALDDLHSELVHDGAEQQGDSPVPSLQRRRGLSAAHVCSADFG